VSVQWITADVFDGLAQLEDASVDLVVTSPPFLALRSYLPTDHPDKEKEIGSETTPAEFIDTMLRVVAELRRVLAPHGSICIEIGDTYAGSGGAGGDYKPGGWRAGQPGADGSMKHERKHKVEGWGPFRDDFKGGGPGGDGWPLAKSKALIPQLLEVALAYGINPLTGAESPAGRWRIRNVVTWARPNPPVGALGDKWRPATSDVIVACVSGKRYWDDLATRKDTNNSHATSRASLNRSGVGYHTGDDTGSSAPISDTSRGAPLLDYWVIPPTGYPGSHYAVMADDLVVPLVQAMLPPKVCRTCGEPSRRIVDTETVGERRKGEWMGNGSRGAGGDSLGGPEALRHIGALSRSLGWTDCGHDDYRPPVILDPFAGSGTTLAVALGHNPDATAIGIDLDERNEMLARDRVGPLLWAVTG
jgi:hypothetical protein